MDDRGATPRQNLEVRVIGKAMKDEAYRQALIASPKAVLNRELGEMIGGVRLPDAVEVMVVEETPNNLCIVLPPRPRGRASCPTRSLPASPGVGRDRCAPLVQPLSSTPGTRAPALGDRARSRTERQPHR
jgi:hypothetical protein